MSRPPGKSSRPRNRRTRHRTRDGESACKRGSVTAFPRCRWPSIYAAYPGVARTGERATHAPCSTLLRVGVAEPPGSPRTLVRSYRTVAPLPVAGEPAHRRSLSVARSDRSPRPGSRQHPALWSPDFPRPGHAGPRPSGQLTVEPSAYRPASECWVGQWRMTPLSDPTPHQRRAGSSARAATT